MLLFQTNHAEQNLLLVIMNEQLLTDEQGYDGKKHFGQTFN